MKEMTCAAAGGPSTCSAVISGNTVEEMLENGMKHVTEAHSEMAVAIRKMPKEDMAKFLSEFHSKFDALPELPA